MSLVAWYPLTEDGRDYSGNNIDLTITGATQNTSNRKIGNCYTFAATNTIRTTTGLTVGSNISICGWGYCTSFATGQMLWSLNQTGGPDLYFAGSTISWNQGDGTANPFKNGGTNVTLPSTNAWHHYCLINNYDENSAILYVDGVYYGTAVNAKNTTQVNEGFTIGNYYSGSTSYAWIGEIADIKVYDHCLSEKERIDIYRTKIAHYKFDENDETTENILATTGVECQAERSGTGYPYYYFDISAKVKELWSASNNVITISFDGRMDYSGTGYPAAYVYFTDWTWATSVGCAETTWTRRTVTATMPDPTTKTIYFAVYHYTSGSSGTSYSRRHQVEFKDHDTPFIHGVRTGYALDCSGYGNTITMPTKTPEWQTAAALGAGSYNFTAAKSEYLALPNDKALKITDKMTLSFWVSRADWSTTFSAQMPIACLYSSGWNVYLLTSGSNIFVYANLKNTGGSMNTINNYAYSAMPPGSWQHIAITYDGYYLRNYFRGSYISDDTGGNYPIVYYDTNHVIIGASASNYNYAGGNYWDGGIDDIRVYATALTEAEINEIKEERESISDTGKVYGNFLEERCCTDINNNLVRNGYGNFGDNTNFTSMTYVANTNLPNCTGVFQYTGTMSTVWFTDFIPVNVNDTYYNTVSARVTTGETDVRIFSCIYCYDEFYNLIAPQNITVWSSSCNTTLAANLNYGATSLTLTSSTGWTTLDCANSPWVYAAMCTEPFPDDYSYMQTYLQVASVSGTTVNLSAPYGGSTIPAGTKITATQAGSMYTYNPAYYQLLTSAWQTFSATITGESSYHADTGTFRRGTKYIRMGLLANFSGSTSTTTCQYGQFEIKNITSPQNLIDNSYCSFDGKGNMRPFECMEIGIPVRYIKDTINGSSSNSSNHWCQIKAFNRVGANVATNKTSSGPTGYQPSGYIFGTQLVTNDVPTWNYYAEHATVQECTVDLGEIIDICSVKIWHYWGDARVYHNTKTEVSADGTNWITIFDSAIEGEYVETADGHEIIIYPTEFSISDIGNIYTTEVVEGE